MAIQLQCSNCQKQLRVPEHAAGKKAKCPGCGAMMRVPIAGPSALKPSMQARSTAKRSRCQQELSADAQPAPEVQDHEYHVVPDDARPMERSTSLFTPRSLAEAKGIAELVRERQAGWWWQEETSIGWRIGGMWLIVYILVMWFRLAVFLSGFQSKSVVGWALTAMLSIGAAGFGSGILGRIAAALFDESRVARGIILLFSPIGAGIKTAMVGAESTYLISLPVAVAGIWLVPVGWFLVLRDAPIWQVSLGSLLLVTGSVLSGLALGVLDLS